jgi:hypothetical protein
MPIRQLEKMRESIKINLGRVGCLFLVVILFILGALCARWMDYGFGSSDESRADRLFRKKSGEYINALRSSDPVIRAEYASYVAKHGHNAVLFVPYLIDLLSDTTPLQIVSGPAIAPKSKILGSSVVGETTVGDRALYALGQITDNDFDRDVNGWQEWWDGWWATNGHRFKEGRKQ